MGTSGACGTHGKLMAKLSSHIHPSCNLCDCDSLGVGKLQLSETMFAVPPLKQSGLGYGIHVDGQANISCFDINGRKAD